jgi:hypothetical protein
MIPFLSSRQPVNVCPNAEPAYTQDAHPGDPAMKPTGKMLGLATLLAFVLSASTVRGDNPEKPNLKDEKQLLEDISKKLDGLITKNQADMRELREALQRLEERVRALEGLRDQLSTSARRNTRFSPSTSVSAYPPELNGTGTIRLRNTSPTFAQVYLNGKAYNVPALETVVLPSQPAGEFTYRVFVDLFGEITPTLTRTLGANETYTITIYPR